MKIVIRADASFQIGQGHIMRCLALAEVMNDKGAEVHFICRNLPGFDMETISGQGFSVHLLPGFGTPVIPEIERNGLAHTEWLPCSQEKDALDCLRVMEPLLPIDWVVVDHYCLDGTWEQLVGSFSKKLFVLDDLADRVHCCDFLLDQACMPGMDKRYAGLIPSDCRLVLGSDYALLRPEFVTERQHLDLNEGDVRRVLIFFGGADNQKETVKILEALKTVDRSDIAVDVVIGRFNPDREEIERLVDRMPNVTKHLYVREMAELIAKSDLAIGAGGMSVYERCCMGVPSFVVIQAENQHETGRRIQESKAGWHLGRAEELSKEVLAEHFNRILSSPEELKSCSRNAFNLVDGRGTFRVAELMGQADLEQGGDKDRDFFSLAAVTDQDSWINDYLAVLFSILDHKGVRARWVHRIGELKDEDVVFYLGCSQKIPRSVLLRHQHNLVVHESALPRGRGWSPMTWQVLEGKDSIPIVLFEAGEKIDSGPVYLKREFHFKGHELVSELRVVQAVHTMLLCLDFVNGYPEVIERAEHQKGQPSFYPRRGPRDSCIDPDKSIREQFHLFRVADNTRYPVWFEMNGKKYLLRIEKNMQSDET